MTDNEQIIEIAKLDGEDIRPDGFHWQKGVNCGLPVESVIQNFKPYLTSRDAIVPVIEKQINSLLMTIKFFEAFGIISRREFDIEKVEGWKLQIWLLTLPANQLCEALLRATGNWKEQTTP